MIAIPTTAGTGSEVTASAVITDTERNYKLSVFSYEILPKYAVLDPELIMTAPASIAASCGVDALIHAMEAYVSRNATPFSDAMAEKAMELIGGNLRRFVANRQDEEAACAMMLGSNFAGHLLCLGSSGQCPRHEPPGERLLQRAPRCGKLHPAAQCGGVQRSGRPWPL